VAVGDVFSALMENTSGLKIVYPGAFKMEGEIGTFTDNTNVRESVTHKATLQCETQSTLG
jgi:hypothetical protein